MKIVDDGRPLGEVLDQRQKMLLLGSMMLAMFIGAIDQTVVSTATPRILADLGGFDLLSWLFTSYMLASTVVVPLVGKMSDIFGRKMFVIAGIVIFMVSSAAAGAAPNMISLISFRAVQGIGGGMIFASVFSTIGDIFPPSERGKYMGMFTGVFSLASILGPTVGGFLTDNGGWRWVFYINVPFSLVAIPAIWFNLPARRSLNRPRIDFLGAFLLSGAAVLLLLAFEWAGEGEAWGSLKVGGSLVAGVALVGGFIYQETRHSEPIIPLHLFRNRTFVIANLTVFTLGMGMFGTIQYLGLFVQTALGASATASGIISTPQSLGLLISSVVAGQLIARRGHYRNLTIFGSFLILAAMLFLRTLDVGVVKWHISAYMVLLGLGIGLVMPTMSLSVQNAVPYRYLGVASSSNQFFRQMGSVFGIAIFAVVLTNSYESSFNDRVPAETRGQLAASGTLDAFLDPTLALNPREYAIVTARVDSLDNGPAILASTNAAQRSAVAFAVRNIFTGAVIVAVVCVILTLLMKEIPLRRDFKSATTEGAGDGEARATEPVTSEPVPVGGGIAGR
ncbi:MAG: MFS transporter [Chloroflexi bacterium]|nr:MFS transporter [Chloroflexota bacterium]